MPTQLLQGEKLRNFSPPKSCARNFSPTKKLVTQLLGGEK